MEFLKLILCVCARTRVRGGGGNNKLYLYVRWTLTCVNLLLNYFLNKCLYYYNWLDCGEHQCFCYLRFIVLKVGFASIYNDQWNLMFTYLPFMKRNSHLFGMCFVSLGGISQIVLPLLSICKQCFSLRIQSRYMTTCLIVIIQILIKSVTCTHHLPLQPLCFAPCTCMCSYWW